MLAEDCYTDSGPERSLTLTGDRHQHQHQQQPHPSLSRRALARALRRRRSTTLDQYAWIPSEEELQPLEGQLYKYTNVVKGWQYRWFTLDPNTGMLEYFEKEEYRKNRPRGSVFLAGAEISPSDEDSQTFTVHAANGEIYRLKAFDAKERQHWVNRIRATAEYHLDNLAQTYPPVGAVGLSAVVSSNNNHALNTPRQHAVVSSNNNHAATTPRQHAVVRSVDVHPPASLQRIFHPDKPGIVHERRPRTDVFEDVKDTLYTVRCHIDELRQRIEDLPSSDQYISAIDKDILLLKATSLTAMACLQQCLSIMQHKQGVKPRGARSTGHIEWLETRSSSITSLPGMRRSSQQSGSVTSVPALGAELKAEPVNINHDEEIEDICEYSDTALDGVEEHKSVILHLLSQLKLGMDLTKVVLPTFILEKRSLLEMFADCMAHPDCFINIPDRPDPESRMLAVVEWYLTSFHVSRKGSIAKKPYNPIIGEHFHCSWRVSPNTSSLAMATDIKDGSQAAKGVASAARRASSSSPQPSQSPRSQGRKYGEQTMGVSSAKPGRPGDDGAPKNHRGDASGLKLYYCAEQVSHHPPVSAFYFECPEKEISMNGSIWTKSKFMGMSIGVVMVGKVQIHLLQHDEVYVLSLPSAYARSILTVPWVELGDKINISCSKTGYAATVTFHTKPFYGGKLHRVSTEVKNMNTMATCCRVNGEWNGALEFSYTNGFTKVIDTCKQTTIRKRVRPLAQQEHMESRALWQHVTQALMEGDLNKATEHKRYLEERQREGERMRLDHNTPFPTKYFHPEGDQWVFNTPLKKGDFKGSA